MSKYEVQPRRSLAVFEVDNVLLSSWKIYDEIFVRVSKAMFGEPFTATCHIDGSDDRSCFTMSLAEILQRRLAERGRALDPDTEEKFFETIQASAPCIIESIDPPVALPDVRYLLGELIRAKVQLVLLSSGSKEVQRALLRRAKKLSRCFDWPSSLFAGQFLSKGHALKRICKECAPDHLLHFSAQPADIRATKEAHLSCQTSVIAVRVAAQTPGSVFIEAGADVVLNDYRKISCLRIMQLLAVRQPA